MTPLDIILILNSSLALQFMVNNKLSTLSTWFEQNLLSIKVTVKSHQVTDYDPWLGYTQVGPFHQRHEGRSEVYSQDSRTNVG